MRKVNRAL